MKVLIDYDDMIRAVEAHFRNLGHEVYFSKIDYNEATGKYELEVRELK